MKLQYKYFFIFFITLCNEFPLKSFDQSVFYHARFFPGEPRLAENWLTSVDMRGSGGSSKEKTDGCGILLKNAPFSRYRTHHFIFDLAQNFCHGWFVSATIPLHRIHILEEPEEDRDFSSLSNMNFMAGWTLNYEETIYLDFIDFTLETGIILPTAKKPAQSRGMPFHTALAFGIYDWLSWGIQGDIILFFDGNNGRLWDLNWYIKADHFLWGFSALFGYSHSNQTEAPVPWNETTIPFWSMDTFHFFVSYDTAKQSCTWAPHIEFFYNHVLSGKNIIKNSIFGLQIGTNF
jgi:hypothetical protein